MYNPRTLGALGVFIAGARICGMLAFFAASAILARELGRTGFGQFVLAISVIVLLAGLVRMGLHRVILRSAVEHASDSLGDKTLYTKLHNSVYQILVVNSVLLLGIGAMSVLAGWPLEADYSFWAAVLLAAIPMAFMQVRSENLRGFGAVKEATLLDCQRAAPTVNLIFLAEIVGFSFLSGREMTSSIAVWLYAVATWAVLTIGWSRVALRLRGLGIDKKSAPLRSGDLVGVARQALPIAVAELIAIASLNSDLWIAKATLGSGDVADLGAAMQLCLFVVMPLSLAGTTISHIIPKMYSRGEKAQLEVLMRRVCAVAALLAIPLILAICLFPQTILTFVYGTGFAEAYQVLLTICIAKCVFMFVGTTGLVLVLTGNQRHALIVNGVALMLQVPLAYAGAVSFGLGGLVVASSCVSICHSIMMLLVTQRATGMWTHCSFEMRSLLGTSWTNTLRLSKQKNH